MKFVPCSTVGWLATALCLKFEGFEITHPVRGSVIDDSVQLLEPTVPYQVSAIYVEHVYCSENVTKLFPIALETLQLICKHFYPEESQQKESLQLINIFESKHLQISWSVSGVRAAKSLVQPSM